MFTPAKYSVIPISTHFRTLSMMTNICLTLCVRQIPHTVNTCKLCQLNTQNMQAFNNVIERHGTTVQLFPVVPLVQLVKTLQAFPPICPFCWANTQFLICRAILFYTRIMEFLGIKTSSC